MIRIELESGSDWLSRLAGEWEELLLDSELPTPFHTLEWLRSWSSTLGKRHRICLAKAYEGNDLVGAIPLIRKVGLGAGYRSMAVGVSDYLHPILRRSAPPQAMPLMVEMLSEGGANVVDLQQTRSGLIPMPGKAVQFDQAACLSLDLPPSYPDYLQMLGKSLRTDCRRANPAEQAKLGLSIVRADASNVQACLQSFFWLHASRWRSRGQPGAFLGRQRFHCAWVDQAVQHDMLRLRLLVKDGAPVGAIYAMKFGETTFFYQAGMNPDLRSLSPGTILIADLIRSSIEEGVTTFDFLRGDEPYKRRWKPQHSHTNCRYLWLPKGLRGSVLEQVQKLSASAETKLRNHFEGSGSKR